MSMRSSTMRAQADCEPSTMQRVLLASEGRPFEDDVVDLAASLVHPRTGRVRVLTIARLWGTGLGIPHPGLRPNKSEMAVHEDNVRQAIRRLKASGLRADGHIITTRKPYKAILGEVDRLQSDVIVMGADSQRTWLVGNLMWSQEPYRVRRRAGVPTHLVCSEEQS
jgi:nucleotide-binding universal stress UspA family protein